jgi:hypothetical protein
MEEASTIQLQKKGLGFFNSLISALAQKFLTELTDQENSKDPLEGELLVMLSIEKLENKEQLWPEMVRLIFKHYLVL